MVIISPFTRLWCGVLSIVLLSAITSACVGNNDTAGTVPVGFPPVAKIIQPSGPATISQGAPLDFRGYCDDPEGRPGEYGWDFGAASGVPQSSEQNPAGVVFNVPGIFTVSFGCTDGQGNASVSAATVAVTVLATLVSGPLALVVDEDIPGTDVLPGYSTDSQTAVYEIVERPHHGQVQLNNLLTGAFSYQTAKDYDGSSFVYGDPDYADCRSLLVFPESDCFTFRRRDGIRYSPVATVTITITPVNDAPVVQPLIIGTYEDTPVSGFLPGSDPDGPGADYQIVVYPLAGNLVIDDPATGAFTYTPEPDDAGTHTFTFLRSDTIDDSAVATGTIIVAPVNDLPQTVDTGVTTDEDVAVMGYFSGSDPDGPVALYSVVTGPSQGRVTVTNAVVGEFTYTPNRDVNGADAFTYRRMDGIGVSNISTVTVTINPVNDTPVARPDTGTATEDGPSVVLLGATLTANDSDIDVGEVLGVVCPPVGGCPYASDLGVPIDVAGGDLTYDHTGMFQNLRQGQTLTDTFIYYITDTGSAESSATVTITVTGVNDPPVAADDAIAVTDGSGLLNIPGAALLTNDTDPDAGDTGTVVSVDASSVAGAVVGLAGGNVVYNPGVIFRYLAAGDTTSDTFTYTMEDGSGAQSVATVMVTVTGVNNAPSAANDSATVAEKAPTLINAASLLANDTDIDVGDTLRVQSTPALSQKGASLSVNGVTGDVTYNPGLRFIALRAVDTATDSFTYRVRDSLNAEATATVTVTIQGENDPPVASADVASAIEKGPAIQIPVLTNDFDPDNSDTRMLASVDALSAQGAAVSISGNFAVYDHAGLFHSLRAGATATDTFSYTMQDSGGLQSSALVTVTVTGVNDAPIAADDSPILAANAGFPLIDVLANDTDIDIGDSKAVLSVIPQSTLNIPLSISSNRVRYGIGTAFDALAAGDTANDTFTYIMRDAAGLTSGATVFVTVTGVNNPPVAVPDLASAVDGGGVVTINVFANDTDVDIPDTKTLLSVTSPSAAGATVTVNSNNADYDPGSVFQYLRAGQTASDTFFYTMEDSQGAQSTAKVTVIVTGINNPPVAQDDLATATENGNAITVSVLANDSDSDSGDSILLTGVTSTLAAPGVSDQGVTITIVNQRVVYAPNTSPAFESLAPGDTAADAFLYTIRDIAGSTDQGTVNVTVQGQNDPPVAIADDFTAVPVFEDGTFVDFDVIANDLDVDNGDSASLLSVPAFSQRGASLSNQVGLVRYDPATQFQYLAEGVTELDQFTYIATDTHGGTAIGSAFVQVTGVNDAPVALADFATAKDGSSQIIDVLANDQDVDLGDSKALDTVPPSSIGGGTLLVLPGNLIQYTPGPAFQYLRAGATTVDSFSYVMIDGWGDTSAAVVQIVVRGVNDTPLAVPDTALASEDGPPVLINVMANDTDPDLGDTLELVSVTNSAAGAVVQISAGQVEYRVGSLFQYLAAGQTINDTFTYTIRDQDWLTSTATVTVTISGRNDSPGAINDTAVALEDGPPVFVDVLANDTDADAGAVFTLSSIPPLSTLGAGLQISGNMVRYDPGIIRQDLAEGQTVLDTFSYSMTDSQGGVSSATVTVAFTGKNDSPSALPDIGFTAEDGDDIDIFVLLNDSDVDYGDMLSILSVSATNATGTAVYRNGEAVAYSVGAAFQHLNVGETGIDFFNYTVVDPFGATGSAAVTVYVVGVNDAPVAVDDTGNAVEDGGPALVDVLANDTDPDTNDVRFVVSVPAFSGQGAGLSVVANQVSYDPGTRFQTLGAGQTATDMFTYQMQDGYGEESSASVLMTITGTNDVPVALADSGTAVEDGPPVSIDVLANDHDTDSGDILTLAGVSPLSQAGASIAVSEGRAVYSPGALFQWLNAGHTTTDAFTYTVQDNNGGQSSAVVAIHITGVNDGPVAVSDTSIAIEDGGPVIVNVLANDSDPDFLSTILLVSADPFSQNGAVVSTSVNDVIYDPGSLFQELAIGEVASDELSYVIQDEYGVTATGKVFVTVYGRNDPPVTADDEGAATEDGGPVLIDVLANDFDPDFTDMLSIRSLPALSSAGAYLSVSGGQVSYNPGILFQHLGAGATAEDTFSYVIQDGAELSSTARVTVTITGVNDDPVALNDSVSVPDGSGPVLIDVLANDTDPDEGDTKAIDAIPAFSVMGASLQISGDRVRYDPGSIFGYLGDGQTGSDSFTYIMRDGLNATSSATVTVTMTGGNSAPDAMDDDFTWVMILEDGPPVLLDVLANDTDLDASDSKTLLSITHSIAGATVAIAANQARYYVGTLFQYLGDGDTADDAFEYIMRDSAGVTDSALVQVRITGINDAPVAAADTIGITEGLPNLVPHASFLVNDSDIDATDIISVNGAFTDAVTGILGLPVNVTGTDIEIDASAVSFILQGSVFTDTFRYAIEDSFGEISYATVTLSIAGTNEAPVFVAPPPGGISCREGDEVSVQASVTDGDTYPVSQSAFSDAGTGSCAFISVSTDGVMTGTCPALGNACTVDVTVDDGFATDGITYTFNFNTRFVTVAGNGVMDGTSWSDAYPDSLSDINQAVSDLSANGGGSVWFASGDYDDGGSSMDTITLMSAVDLYGGFAGTEAAIGDRPVPAGETRINGAAAGGLLYGHTINGVVLDSLSLTNSSGSCIEFRDLFDIQIRHMDIDTCNGHGIYLDTDFSAEIHGISISDTQVTEASTFFAAGAGISVNQFSDVLLDGVTLVRNEADLGYGGGLYAYLGSALKIRDSVVEQGYADYGGGVALESVSGLEIDGLVVDNNWCDAGGGGGIFLYDVQDASAHRLYVTANGCFSASGGGLLAEDSAGIRVIDATFVDNYSDDNGGGVYLYYSQLDAAGISIAENSTMGDGGGIYLYESSLNLVNGSFHRNVADVSSGTGGSGGAVRVTGNSIFFISNSASYGNVRNFFGFPIFLKELSEIVAEAGTSVIASRLCSEERWSDDSVILDGTAVQLSDPFRRGPFGRLSLRRTADGDSFTSACVDLGDPVTTADAFAAGSLDWQDYSSSFYGMADAYPPDAGALHVRPKVYYVSSGSGDDSNDGLSWSTAKQNVQAANDLSGWGDHIWVDTGVQTGDLGSSDPVLRLGRGVMVFGGFAGAESHPVQRPAGSLTEFSGDRDGSNSATPGDAGPVIEGASDARIDRLNIRWGYNTDGACLHNSYALRVTVADSLLEECEAAGLGGAIHSDGWFDDRGLSYALIVEDSTIRGSRASFGGGISSLRGRVNISGSIIEGNDSANGGGGILIDEINNPIGPPDMFSRITESRFISNSSPGFGGGLAVLSAYATLLDGLTFNFNTAADGAGLFVADSPFNTPPVVLGIDLTFDGNSAAGDGGGMLVRDASLFLTQMTFRNNTADSDADGNGDGGGIHVDPFAAVSLEMSNSAFYGNTDLDGGTVPAPVSDYSDLAGSGNPEGLCSEENLSLVDPFNIHLDGNSREYGNPFVTDGVSRIYLANAAAGDGYTSACMDGGQFSLSWVMMLFLTGRIDFFSLDFPYTTSASGDPDDLFVSNVDAARHYSAPNTIYVTKEGAGAGDGSSWANAARGLQNGISLAGAGDRIWAKADTYTASSTGIMFTMDSKPGVNIWGGFAGSESRLEERTAGSRTVLNGNATSSQIVNISGSPGARLDGFRVTGGRNSLASCAGAGIAIASSDSTPVVISNSVVDSNSITGTNCTGAGLYATGSSLRINDSTFELNNSDAAVVTTNGGGVYFTNGTKLEISNSVFRSNSIRNNGGGIYLGGPVEFESWNSRYESNSSTSSSGGAIYASNVSSLAFNGDVFADNQSPSNGGAVHVTSLNTPGTAVTSTDVRWENNRATNDFSANGGAFYAQRGSAAAPGLDIRFTGGEFVNNFMGNAGALAVRDTGGARVSTTSINSTKFAANTGVSAVAMFIDNSVQTDIVDVECIGNRGTHLDGAAVHAGGAALLRNITDLSIVNSVFRDNLIGKLSTSRGGALFLQVNASAAMNVEIVNSVFRGNVNPSTGAGGGGTIGIRNDGTQTLNMAVTNSSFADNYSAFNGGVFSVYTGAGATTDLTVWNSAFYGNLDASASNTTEYFVDGTGTNSIAVNNSCGMQDLAAAPVIANSGYVQLTGAAQVLGDPFNRMATGELFLKSTATGDAYTTACADIGSEAQAAAAFAGAGLGDWFDYTTAIDDPVLGGPYLDTDGGGANDVDAGIHYIPQFFGVSNQLRTPAFTASNAVLAAGSNVTLSVVPQGTLTGCDIYYVAAETLVGSIPGGPGTISATFDLLPGLYRADCAELSDYRGSSYVVVREAVLTDLSNTGTETGKSWASGFNTAAEAAAAAYPTLHDIWLKRGTYRATSSASLVNLQPYVGLYGGFEGTETGFPSERLGRDETVLSGDVNNNQVANAGDSSTVVRVRNGAIIDGVTVEYGYTLSVGGGIGSGGYINSITLNNLAVRGNYAEGFPGGAGIYLQAGPAFTGWVSNASIQANTGYQGAGGLLVDGSTGFGQQVLTLNNMEILDNIKSTNAFGFVPNAGISVLYASADISDSVFSNNTMSMVGHSGAALRGYNLGGVSEAVTVRNSVFDANANIGAGTAGAAIATQGDFDVAVFNSSFRGNSAATSSSIYVFGNTTQTLSVANSVFYGNSGIADIWASTFSAANLDNNCAPAALLTVSGGTVPTNIAQVLLDGSTPALSDPFTDGPTGELFLRHNGLGNSTYTSACVDSGSDGLVPFAFVDQTTRLDGTLDAGTSDIGVHYDPSRRGWISSFNLTNGGATLEWRNAGNITSCEIRNADIPAQVVHVVSSGQLIHGTWEIPGTGPAPEYTLVCTDVRGERLETTILGTNEPPVAGTDLGAAQENGPVVQFAVATLLANDSDPNSGDYVTFVSVASSSAAGVPVSLLGQNVEYDPSASFDRLTEGELFTDTFTYTIRDQNGNQATGTVEVTVTGVNDPVSFATPLGTVTCRDGESFGVAPVLADTDSGDLYLFAEIAPGGVQCSSYPGAGGGAWYSVDGMSGTISGTCPALGTSCEIRLEVTELDGSSTDDTLTVETNTRYVTIAGDGIGGDGSGNSWTDAHNAGYLQVAVDEAMALPGGKGQVFIGEGTYQSYSGPGTPVISVSGPVRIYGGFAGTVPVENSVSDRGEWIDPSLVVLDGDTDSSGGGNVGDATSVVYFVPGGEGVLDGLTIRNGFGGPGAGVRLDATPAYPVVLSSLDIRNNTSTGGAAGGGVYSSDAVLTIRNSRIRNNLTAGSDGGGLYATLGDLRIESSQVSDNQTLSPGTFGGGIFVTDMNSQAVIVNTVFDGNSSIGDGGALAVVNSTVSIAHGSFRDNSAAGSAGAMYVDGAGAALSVRNSVFYGNADSGGVSDFAGPVTPDARYTCSQQGFTGTGNITLDGSTAARGDPFRTGLNGRVYLHQTVHGDDYTSACVDAADTVGTEEAYGALGLDWENLTTGFYGDPETALPDMGIHYLRARRWYVSSVSGNDTNDGLSWATAKATPQAALSVARAGDHVWLAYDAYSAPGAGAWLQLKSEVAMIGGFTGGELNYSELDRSERAYFNGNSVAGPVLSGTSVENLHLEGIRIFNASVGGDGGGIYLESSSGVRMERIDMVSNSASGSGGGLFIENSTGVTMLSPQFSNNSADSGAGAYVRSSSEVVFRDADFEGGTASFYGGGLYIESNSLATLIDCEFVGNEAVSGAGGAISLDGASLVASGCRFSNNHAGTEGGAIDLYYATGADVFDSIMEENYSDYGGGVICAGTPSAWTNVIFDRNTADTDGGAMFHYDSCMAGLINTVFNGNLADADADFTGAGGAIAYGDSSTVNAVNSIFWGNRESGIGTVSDYVDYDGFGNGAVEYSCNEQGLGGAGNITLDRTIPELDDPFTRGLQGEFFLKQQPQGDIYTSACVDAGDNAAATAAFAAAGLADWTDLTTALGSDSDIGSVDMGIHYVPATRWYVGPVATGSGNGTSWANRASDLQGILDSAGPYDHVWIQYGTYRGAVNDTSAVAYLPEDIHVFGGFGGTEARFAQRGGYQDLTVLSGDNDGNGFDAGDSLHVVELSSRNWLDGLTIRGGNADGQSGGGIYASGGERIRLRNLNVTENRGDAGGGMHADGTFDIQIDRSEFMSNTATVASGGAISLVSVEEMDIALSRFVSNAAALNGGAISGASVQQLRFLHSLADGNSAQSGGAVSVTQGNLVVRDSAFARNMAVQQAGAIYSYDMWSSLVTESVFLANASQDACGAVLDATNPLSLVISSTFTGNTAVNGGGAICSDAFGWILNSSFRGNSAGTDGGGILYYSDGVALLNSAFHSNQAVAGPDVHVLAGTPGVEYNCAEQDFASDFGSTFFSQAASDPFLSSADGGLFLDPSSACIDRGEDSLADDPTTGFMAMGLKSWQILSTRTDMAPDGDEIPGGDMIDAGAHYDPAAPRIWTFEVVTGRFVSWTTDVTASECFLSGGGMVYSVPVAVNGGITLPSVGTYLLTCGGDARYRPAMAWLTIP